MPYAEGTDVSVERSISEAQRLLRKHGVGDVGFSTGSTGGRIQFLFQGRAVQFSVKRPAITDPVVTQYASGKPRPGSDRQKRVEQVERERWRAMVLVLKGKLEAVESGVETWEEAFLPQILLPDGTTVAERVAPQLESAYRGGPVAGLLQLES